MSRFSLSLKLRTSIGCLFFILISINCASSYAEGLQSGSRFKIICPLYLMANYDNVDNKQLNRKTARAFLYTREPATRYFTAFKNKVPVGTIMSIIGPAPKIWYLPFSADSYFVRLDPDISRGLDIELSLDRGMEGSLDGLNPKLFSKE